MRHDRTHGSDGQKLMLLKSTGLSQRFCETAAEGRERWNAKRGDVPRVGNIVRYGEGNDHAGREGGGPFSYRTGPQPQTNTS